MNFTFALNAHLVSLNYNLNNIINNDGKKSLQAFRHNDFIFAISTILNYISEASREKCLCQKNYFNLFKF